MANYVNSILRYFSTMDIAGLQQHLKDEYIYEDTTKEIFLNEIESIFDAHIQSGDTELLIYKGKCAGKDCVNCGNKGFRFLGNHTKNYMDLLFTIEGDDIKDICSCSNFDTEIAISDLGIQASIDINDDDKASFIKTPEYLAKVNAAQAAYHEMITTPPKLVTFEELNSWLQKHVKTDAFIGGYDIFDPIMKWTTFSKLYNDFKMIKTYISVHFDEIEQANSFISQDLTEPELIEWYFRYESLYKTFPCSYSLLIENDSDNYLTDEKEKITLIGHHFDKSFKFYRFYGETEVSLMAKFNTYTKEEEFELYKNADNDEYIFTLRFHLEKRKEIEAAGISMPFNIYQ